MSALNWVAMENGIEDDPKVRSLASILKDRKQIAFWYVYRLRLFVLQRGNHLSGSLPKKYTARDVAAFVEFKGDPRRLVDAMRETGFLGFKKGRGFFYPDWADTITGRYTAQREVDRVRKEKDRKERQAGAVRTGAGDVQGRDADASSDSPRTLVGNTRERNEGSPPGPPEPPRAGGSLLAEERWQWLLKNAPTPQNPDRSKKYLSTLSDADWALVVRAYDRLQESRSSMSRKEIRDLRVLYRATDKFLHEQAYLRFGVVDRPRRRAPTAELAAAPVSPADELKQRLCQIDGFVTDLLGDPDQPEHAKADAKRRWEEIPENADRTPPWNAPQQGASLNGTGR